MGDDPINLTDPSGGSILYCPGTSAVAIFFDKAFQALIKAGPITAKISIGLTVLKTAAFITNMAETAAMINGQNATMQAGGGTHGPNATKFGPGDPKPVKVGSFFYYELRAMDFQRRFPNGKVPTYYLSYGNIYIKKFKTITQRTLSPSGREWLAKTLVNLQQAIEDKLMSDDPADKYIENNDEEFTDFAFDSHVEAYEKAGVLGLSVMDKVKIMLTPDAKDLFSDRGLQQASKIADDQFFYYLLHPIFFLKQIKETVQNVEEIKEMVHDYYERNKKFFDSFKRGPFPVYNHPEHTIMQLLNSFLPTKIII